ncbi:methyl-accepting chemotaxis protein [Ramlibacter sp. G-1-2-2]|uniref:Methyl-accepting chemotaxis protein n=1 Tax=Ramlibacter agri TaxID=2728837 RepID=A0A848H8C9_9BURK|nr:methyl-accepting chemotaxis protein [Ramlibacter agri]NML46764.1 methyl-accepting chemotaxis protein [Ramlibacter agri]
MGATTVFQRFHKLRVPHKLTLLVALQTIALLLACGWGLAAVQAQPEAWQQLAGVYAVLAPVAILLAVAIAISTQRGLLNALRHAASAARSVADGDLGIEVRGGGQGEMGKMLRAQGEMLGHLRTLVGDVMVSAHTVADTSAQLAQGSQHLSERTEEQASTLEETAGALQELTSTVARNAQDAQKAAQLASGASDVARRGGGVVGEVVSTMDGISAASRRIADITSVIDGIAFQTNILALNAAVEAARAGDQGRGFAVVAAEVRSLAQRSATAAREIKELIADSTQKVEAGTARVAAAGRTMHEVVAAVAQVNELVAGIATASTQQSAGIEQVGAAVSRMDQAVQHNASLVEEAAAAAEAMRQQAAVLVRSVSRFRLGGGTQPAALSGS